MWAFGCGRGLTVGVGVGAGVGMGRNGACRKSLSYEAKKLVFVRTFYRRFCFVVRSCRTKLSYEAVVRKVL